MAMSSAGRRRGPVAEINVTPLADVMIVLLIIAMVVVPTFVTDRLPRAARVTDREDGPPVVTIRKDTSLLLSGAPVARPELLARLRYRLITATDGGRVVYLRADREAPFSTVDDVLDVRRRAGADTVTLVAERKPG
jgi:biopolymer transport protein ExbD